MEAAENKFKIIYDTVNKSNNTLSIKMLCEIAGVSRSGYYSWVKSASIREEKECQDRADFELILTAYRFRGYDKGAQGIHMRLLHMEPPVVMNVKKIRRLMKKYGLICNIRKANPYRRMAKAIRTNHVADNIVNREFELHGPRTILLTDITYILYAGVFCYLSTILDSFTKQILSYVLSESLEVDFVLETVNQSLVVYRAELYVIKKNKLKKIVTFFAFSTLTYKRRKIERGYYYRGEKRCTKNKCRKLKQ